MNRLYLYLLLSLLPFYAGAQQDAGPCFTRTEFAPAFVAISSEAGAQLDSWYSNVLGMKVIKTFTSKDGSQTGKILQQDQLFIEILEQKKIPACPKEHRKGVQKFGIFVDSPAQELQACLQQKGFEPGRIFYDAEMDFFLLHMRDPEGNELEFITKN